MATYEPESAPAWPDSEPNVASFEQLMVYVDTGWHPLFTDRWSARDKAIWKHASDLNYTEGVRDGRAQVEDEYRRHREAARVVKANLRVPEVDLVETTARRARIDARFGTKGGQQ